MLPSDALVLATGIRPAQIADLEGIVETEGVGWEDVAAAAGVVTATLLVAFLLGRLVRRALGRPESQSRVVVTLTVRLVRWGVIILGVAWALSFVGVSVGWFTITVIVTVAIVVLVLKPQIEALAAGLALTFRPAYGVGDEIEVVGHVGEVVEVTTRSTVLRTRDGRRVHVPNATMLSETVVVWSTKQPRRSTLEFRVPERADLDRIESRLLAMTGTLPVVVDDPPPVVLAREIEGGAVGLELRFWHQARIADENKALDLVVRGTLRELEAAGLSTAVDELNLRLVPRASNPA